jgi:hypothetical protein
VNVRLTARVHACRTRNPEKYMYAATGCTCPKCLRSDLLLQASHSLEMPAKLTEHINIAVNSEPCIRDVHGIDGRISISGVCKDVLLCFLIQVDSEVDPVGTGLSCSWGEEGRA